MTGECIRSGGERREDDPISGNSVPQEPLCLMHVLARSEEGALTDRNVILRKKRLIFLMKVADIFNRYSYNDKGLFWNYS